MHVVLCFACNPACTPDVFSLNTNIFDIISDDNNNNAYFCYITIIIRYRSMYHYAWIIHVHRTENTEVK